MAKLAAADDKGQGQETWGCCRDAGQGEDVVDELGEADPQRKLHESVCSSSSSAHTSP